MLECLLCKKHKTKIVTAFCDKHNRVYLTVYCSHCKREVNYITIMEDLRKTKERMEFEYIKNVYDDDFLRKIALRHERATSAKV